MKDGRFNIKGFLWMLLLMLLLPACKKNEFKMEFSFPKDMMGNYMATYYARDRDYGFWVEAPIVLQDGKAVLDGVTRRPTVVYVRDMSGYGKPALFYVEKGDVLKIEGDSSDPLTWRVQGNKESEAWMKWRAENADAVRQGGEKLKKSIEIFVAGNKDSKAAPLMLIGDFDRRAYPEDFIRLWNSLSSSVREKKYVDLFGASDLQGPGFEWDDEYKLSRANGKSLKGWVLRSQGNGVDTLRFNKTKGALLCVYPGSAPSRRECVDSLKSLSKEYPDSSSRIMAEIYADPDSSMWVNSIRHDSLRKAIRGWMPMSVADPQLQNVGVVRLPWFLVADKSGKITYSGDNLGDAVKKFRTLMK